MKKKTLEKLNRDFPGYNIRQIDNHIYINDYKSRLKVDMDSVPDKFKEGPSMFEDEFNEHVYSVIKDIINLEIKIAFQGKKFEDVI